MSDTPRTDKERGTCDYVLGSFARQLERELAEMQTQRDFADAWWKSTAEALNAHIMRGQELERELAEAKHLLIVERQNNAYPKLAATKARAEKAERELAATTKELNTVNEVNLAIMRERDEAQVMASCLAKAADEWERKAAYNAELAEEAQQERDEARQMLSAFARELDADGNVVSAMVALQGLKKERDEYIELLASEKCTRNHIIKRFGQAEMERDEARKALREAMDAMVGTCVSEIDPKFPESWRKAAGVKDE